MGPHPLPFLLHNWWEVLVQESDVPCCVSEYCLSLGLVVALQVSDVEVQELLVVEEGLKSDFDLWLQWMQVDFLVEEGSPDCPLVDREVSHGGGCKRGPG